MKTSKRLMFKKKKKNLKNSILNCQLFLFIFCIAGTLGKIQLPAQENNKQHKPSSPPSYLLSGQHVFIIIFLFFCVFFLEATSKPFDTAEKLTVTVQGLY